MLSIPSPSFNVQEPHRQPCPIPLGLVQNLHWRRSHWTCASGKCISICNFGPAVRTSQSSASFWQVRVLRCVMGLGMAFDSEGTKCALKCNFWLTECVCRQSEQGSLHRLDFSQPQRNLCLHVGLEQIGSTAEEVPSSCSSVPASPFFCELILKLPLSKRKQLMHIVYIIIYVIGGALLPTHPHRNTHV